MNPACVDSSHGLVGESQPVRLIRKQIEKLGRSRSPVLLLGESGTGKEVVARAIHNANPCGNFIPIDCGSLVGPLMESELFGHTRGAFTASQVSAGCKNRLSIEIYGSKSSVAWNQERPDELWIGNRNTNNQVIVKDPSLLKEGARSYADLPGGHSEGYDDTFKQVFRRFYKSIEDPAAHPEYPQFADGLRQLLILDTELASHKNHGWMEVSTS